MSWMSCCKHENSINENPRQIYVQFIAIAGIYQMFYWHQLALNAAGNIPQHQHSLSSITPDRTHRFTQYQTSNLQYSPYSLFPPHFHGSELPLYNTSERRMIQYPNSSTISETRTQPTICDCSDICHLVFACRVVVSTAFNPKMYRVLICEHQHLYVQLHCLSSSAEPLTRWWCFPMLGL